MVLSAVRADPGRRRHRLWADAAIRARVDMASLAMRWPLPLRHFVRVLVGSASTAVFAILVIAARVTMYH